ncbi:DUF881 domain-containing protein [Blastococcus haudaquaticus]|uniref:Uncharacterized conserved protein YlxW, UPF0749 family n=1 Tax=Blastococcus haudaquaticus TaxID=1938745 RepID=A0A286GP84_9ACTN|nr:DUF881 domain-containing protein [Blastococcus haudaquaticus]SOD97347.1 Uncharacterized conserved protein YlxW, UPF0749 family [Blastococcus haudaquaticus]
MSGDQPPVTGPEPSDDQVVVPHPFGPGNRGEEPGEAPAGEADEPVEAPAEPEQPAAEAADAPVSDAAVVDATLPEDVEPEPAATDAVPVPGPAAKPRRTRDPLAAALIGVLTLLLGFAFAVQVRSVGDDQEYAGAREEDLVRILDDLDAREERLREQIADQRNALQQLTNSDSQSAAALDEARARAEAIGILNGTIAAQGPGLTMTIRDPGDDVRVSDVVDAIQELRGAGAETMQIDDVRVGVSSAITGRPGELMVDGRPITAPYEFVVIGAPESMQTALNIPGGVVQDLTRQGATVDIEPSDLVVVDALRPLDTPQYASPDTDD